MKTSGQSENYRHSVRLLVKHPSQDLDVLSERLGIQPSIMRNVGERRQTPAGAPLDGPYRESTWSRTWELTGKRNFFDELRSIVKLLAEHAEFIVQLTESGGSVRLIVSLPGDVNIGDEMNPDDLQALARLKVILGLEVFPVFGR